VLDLQSYFFPPVFAESTFFWEIYGQAFKSTVKKGQFWAESTVTVLKVWQRCRQQTIRRCHDYINNFSLGIYNLLQIFVSNFQHEEGSQNVRKKKLKQGLSI
jgi:hypothetical protein